MIHVSFRDLFAIINISIEIYLLIELTIKCYYVYFNTASMLHLDIYFLLHHLLLKTNTLIVVLIVR